MTTDIRRRDLFAKDCASRVFCLSTGALLGHVIACNVVHAEILRSARELGCELGRVSFKGALDLVRQWLPEAAELHDQPRKLARCNYELLEAIAQVRNPKRPDRREPRAKERRPKSYQFQAAAPGQRSPSL